MTGCRFGLPSEITRCGEGMGGYRGSIEGGGNVEQGVEKGAGDGAGGERLHLCMRRQRSRHWQRDVSSRS
jgi:hypothetical protein